MLKELSFIDYNINRNDEQKKTFSILICFLIALPSILNLINYFVYDLAHISLPIGTLIIYILLFSCIIRVVPDLINNLSIFEFCIFLLITFILCISYCVHIELFDFINQITKSIITKGIFFLFLGKYLYNNKYFNKHIYIVALIIMFSGIINVFFKKNTFEAYYKYSQYDAYVLLPASLIFFNKMYSKFSFFDLIFFIINTFIILSMGARGPLVVIAAFIIFKILINIKKYPKRSLMLLFVIMCFILLYMFLKDEILLSLRNIFINMNLSTRFVDKLLNDSLMTDNVRTYQYRYILKMILEHPFGVTIGYDRILLGNEMSSLGRTDDIIGWYSHNLILDFFLHFGIVGGFIVSISLLYGLIKTLIKTRNNISADVFLLIFCLGIIPLMISGFYLQDMYFMLLIGFMYQACLCKEDNYIIKSIG